MWTLLVAVGVLLICANPFSARHPPFGDDDQSGKSIFPRKIWQVLDDVQTHPPEGEPQQRLSRSWIGMNPNYRHELLRSDSAVSYVQDKFRQRPDIVEAVQQTNDTVMRADLLRYLALLADGGVYADSDTHCSKPISEWVSKEHLDTASLVVGIEYDAKGGEPRDHFTLPVQLCRWAFMGKAGSKALQYVVDRVVEALNEVHGSFDDVTTTSRVIRVPDVTGYRVSLYRFDNASIPHKLTRTSLQIFTKSILEYLTLKQGHFVSYADISSLTEPKLIEDVLFLPITAFGSEHRPDEIDFEDDKQVVSPHRYGFRGRLAAYE